MFQYFTRYKHVKASCWVRKFKFLDIRNVNFIKYFLSLNSGRREQFHSHVFSALVSSFRVGASGAVAAADFDDCSSTAWA